MTISTLVVKNSYNGDGSATQFAYQFPIHSTSEIKVIERSANGTETIKSLGSDYSITDTGNGGSVNFNTAPASGVEVVLIRDTNLTQETDYIANDPFPAETHEAALDKLTLQIQEAQEEIDRSIKLSRTNSMTSTEFTNSATDRAGKILAFDTSGELSIAQELGSNRGNWAASTAYAVRDIVKDTSTNNIFMAKTAHTSSGSQPLTTNTDSAKWDLLVDAASATTSQNAAAASATAASNSETAAASSASTALSHKNDAETAKTAAETAFDNFDDRFLGSKGSDPTLDNDGNALLTGSIYYSTASSEMKVYTGSAWDTLKPSSASQTAINTAVSNIAAIQAASTNATNAANSATAAASSASSAATALSSANTALSSAQAAQTAAELALDQFDDIYLGSKSTDPSTDNDGDALTQGDLYHNSSSNNLRIYHNGAWQDVAVSTTGFAQSGFSIAMSVAL